MSKVPYLIHLHGDQEIEFVIINDLNMRPKQKPSGLSGPRSK